MRKMLKKVLIICTFIVPCFSCFDLNSQTILTRELGTHDNDENKQFYYNNNKQYLIYSNMCTNLDYNNPYSFSIVNTSMAEHRSYFLMEPNLFIKKENDFYFYYFDDISQFCFDCLTGECIHPYDVVTLYRDSLC